MATAMVTVMATVMVTTRVVNSFSLGYLMSEVLYGVPYLNDSKN